MSILLSGEMEVDGDLKVTGTVESTTIDSLKAVIAELQAQMTLQEMNKFKLAHYQGDIFNSEANSDEIFILPNTIEELIMIKLYTFLRGGYYSFSIRLVVDGVSEETNYHLISDNNYQNYSYFATALPYIYFPTVEQKENGFSISFNINGYSGSLGNFINEIKDIYVFSQ